VLGLGVGGGCGVGMGLGWGVGIGWGSKYINQHFVFEETTNTRRSHDDPPQVGAFSRISAFPSPHPTTGIAHFVAQIESTLQTARRGGRIVPSFMPLAHLEP
jgi:hypothetical protein